MQLLDYADVIVIVIIIFIVLLVWPLSTAGRSRQLQRNSCTFEDVKSQTEWQFGCTPAELPVLVDTPLECVCTILCLLRLILILEIILRPSQKSPLNARVHSTLVLRSTRTATARHSPCPPRTWGPISPTIAASRLVLGTGVQCHLVSQYSTNDSGSATRVRSSSKLVAIQRRARTTTKPSPREPQDTPPTPPVTFAPEVTTAPTTVDCEEVACVTAWGVTTRGACDNPNDDHHNNIIITIIQYGLHCLTDRDPSGA